MHWCWVNLLVNLQCHANHELPLSTVPHLLAFGHPLPCHLGCYWWIWEIGKMNIFGPEKSLIYNECNNAYFWWSWESPHDRLWIPSLLCLWWCPTMMLWICSFLHDCIWLVRAYIPNLFTLDKPQLPCHLSALDEWSHNKCIHKSRYFFTTTTFQPHQMGVGSRLTPSWVTVSLVILSEPLRKALFHHQTIQPRSTTILHICGQ